LWFYAPLDTNRSFRRRPTRPLLAWYEKKLNVTQQNHTFTNQQKCTTTQNTLDAKIQITVTTAYLIRIKYPLSSFNYHLSDINTASFNKIHHTVSELFKKWNSKTEVSNIDFVEICNVCTRKVTIKAAKRIFNSDKICCSYCDFYFGFTFLEHSVNTKKLQRGLVASYDIWPGNGEGLFWFWRFINLYRTDLLRQLQTYLQPRTPMGCLTCRI